MSMQPESSKRMGPRPSLLRDFSVAQLKLIRRSIARTCTDAEFDEFIECARRCGLDPLRRQLAPLIVNGDDPDKRSLIPWATIDGLRIIAARQGDYRPMEIAPLIECDAAKVDPDANPLGITRAEVVAWKRSENAWFPVAGEAWWDEHAPLREEWASAEDGRRVPTGKLFVDQSWKRMGRIMIAKCAEAQALRRGWPDVLSGLYGEEELHGVRRAELSASEMVRNSDAFDASSQRRTRTLWFVFEPGGPFVPVVVERALAELTAFYCGVADPALIEQFNQTNWSSLQTLWEWAPADALALKRLAEARAGGEPIQVTAVRSCSGDAA